MKKTPEAVVAELKARGLGKLLTAVCRRRHLLPLEVCGPSRVHDLVEGRHELWRMIRKKHKWSYPMIGNVFGVDHTTIIYAVGKEYLDK